MQYNIQSLQAGCFAIKGQLLPIKEQTYIQEAVPEDLLALYRYRFRLRMHNHLNRHVHGLQDINP